MGYKIRESFEKETTEMRAMYCQTLLELARQDDRICILDADLVGSSGTKPFFKEFPERAFDCGIQESNMIGVAGGLSAMGMVPFAHSFGPFATRRVADQIFISCAYSRQNVRIIGSDPGVTAAYNGGTHMPFEDMATLMGIPKIVLIEPTDTVQMQWLIRQLQNEYGVFYIRLLRKNATGVYAEGSTFEIGKAPVLRDGTDVCIAASGIMVEDALKAAQQLESMGISAAVINTFTWKPMDEQTLTHYAKKCGCFVTAENHNVIGGLGSAVASTLARTVPAPVEMVGVFDSFGEVGDLNYLRKTFNLNPEAIVKAAQRAVSRK